MKFRATPLRIAVFLTIVFLPLFISCSLAYATADGAIQQEFATVDGKQFLQNLYNSVSGWGDYSCQSDLQTFKPDKVVKSRCKFFYKKLNQVRVEVVGGGYRNGTTIVKEPNGSVRAHGGLMLGGIKMNLDPDSRMLILPNGFNAIKIDFVELLADLKEKVNSGYSCLVSQAPATVTDLNEKVYLLDIYTPPKSGKELYARVFVTADERFPVRWEIYTGGQLFSSAEFKNLITNTGLGDDMFHL